MLGAVDALFVGPNKLLQWLEAQLGLGGYEERPDYLRIELYRQVLDQLKGDFYAASFHADRLATAEYLLGWRDELLSAGWNFKSESGMPERLQVLADAEKLFQIKITSPEMVGKAYGYADRFEMVLDRLATHRLPISRILLYEPRHLQKPFISRLLNLLEDDPTLFKVESAPTFPQLQCEQICILKCKRDSDAAVFVAQLLRENQGFHPLIVAPQSSWVLEQAMLAENLPAIGIPSASLARPSMQVLKLAQAFLWEPVDVYKIMEFLTLPIKPLDGSLALEIARVMAEKPGIFSDTWFAAVYGMLEKESTDAQIKAQYDFWFNRRRYPVDQTAPKRDAEVIYNHLHEWAIRLFDETGGTNSTLLVLAEQARRINALLTALPEQRISFLDLERIVRTIFEASPTQLAHSEAGALPFIHSPGALAAPTQDLIWWNFVSSQETAPPDKWQLEERNWLEERHIQLLKPTALSRLKQIMQMRPLEQVSGKLLLLIPEQVDGAETQPHLLLSDIEAALKDAYIKNVFHIDEVADQNRLKAHFKLPDQTRLPAKLNTRVKPQIVIQHPDRIDLSEYETPTNLERLFYYPHRWFFRQKLKLFSAPLLSIINENTLLGNLAHRIFEKLLEGDFANLSNTEIFEWVDQESKDLFPKEGAPLLMYGREPERNAFLRRIKHAAWNLVSVIRNNAWEVEATELEMQGLFMGMPVKGKADLVLGKGAEKAIVDLKWSGAKRRKEQIMNGEDLQLVLYAWMLSQNANGNWPHTAYFILEDSKLIARNNHAFKEVQLAGRGESNEDAYTAVFSRMERTYAWRLEQIQSGIIEIRTARTAIELEAMYEGLLMDVLEMKSEDARWDDYAALLM
ncbi:MAG: PD-(D/E)XK nuclease family protein [Saprospiraceae bacterium]|nr:PD-(D/E)XK nuclease family protein [Saprospiraceae bacterium]